MRETLVTLLFCLALFAKDKPSEPKKLTPEQKITILKAQKDTALKAIDYLQKASTTRDALEAVRAAQALENKALSETCPVDPETIECKSPNKEEKK